MTLGVVAVSGAAAVSWTQAEENVVRPEAPGSNAGEVWVASTEFKFVPATVRVIAGRSITLVLDNRQAETEHGIKLPAFGFYLIARGGQVTRKTFIFDKPGEYEFMCDLPGHQDEALTSKQFPQQPQRRGLVALGLDQDFENLAFAVDCAPHVHLPSSD